MNSCIIITLKGIITMSKILESGEDYLETILILHNKLGYVRSVDVAVETGYSKPSVSRAMGILKNAGYITVDRGGQLILTEAGKKKAESIYERHLIITDFFENILGVSHENAERDACKIEHDLSDESYEKLKEFAQKK